MRSLPTQLLRRRLQARQPGSTQSQRGVALIESLVSILIFSFGVIGLIGLEANAINFSMDAEDRNRAAVIANEVASDMWLNDSVTLTAAQNTTWQANVSNTATGGLPNGTLTITPTAGTTNSADILITWKPPTDAATVPVRQFTTRVILP